MSRSFYVTTPIYYVNDAPHIGHAYTTVHADVLARWRRLHGDDVLFLTGTDEHGLKIQRAAEERGVTPQEWADVTSARFREAWQLLDITNDDFIRTTEDRHRIAVQAFLQQVQDNGFIELATYEGLYCVACEAYYTEDDLVDGLCPIHHRPVEKVTEENYFFQLSKFEQPLLDHYAAHPEAVQPDSKRNEVLGFIRQGLRDFSMSRTSISWGIPLPWDPAHVTYVWYDALINYATAVGFGADPDRFAYRWPVQYHLIAKDILRFHAVYWPAMLMAAGLPLPETVFAHGYLLVGGEKMSKTSLNNIAPADLVPEFGSDGFRYHVVTDLHFGQDGDFSYEGMVARYNADLANNFGNLASRVLNMVVSYCGGVVPDARADGPLAARAATALDAMESAFADLAFDDAFGAVWQLIRDANAYIEEQQPWATHKGGDVAATAAVLGDCLEVLRVVALLASPVIPRAAAELWRRLGLSGAPEDARVPDAALGAVPTSGNVVEKGPSLFPRRRVTDAVPGPQGHGGLRWVDSHCHLPDDPTEADAIVDAARADGVEWLVCVGTDLATSRAAVKIAERRSDIVATVGLHPHDASRLTDEWADLVTLAAGPRVVAVGECGLDHHYEHSPGPAQADAFRAQIRLAHELDRTLVIHTREAWAETFAILDDEVVPDRTVFHCFTGGPDEARACLDRGAALSFSGIVTFKNADDVRGAAAITPRDRMLVETDSPYLAPVPHRGQPNRPAWVGAVGEGLAAARAEPVESVADATRANATRFFRTP